MERYLIAYTIHNNDWRNYLKVEEMLVGCGDVWVSNTLRNLVRLDSDVPLMSMQHKMNTVLDLENGDTYYVVRISEYRSCCDWTLLVAEEE